MANKRTLEETTRSSIDGSEAVRLATTGANWQATLANIFAALGKTVLTVDTSYYLAPTGSDSTGDGSSGNPWQTFTKANAYLRDHIDFGGKHVQLIMRDAGTYTGATYMGGYVGAGILSIHGATNAPASYIVVDDGSIAQGVFHFTEDTMTEVRFDQLTFKPVTQSVDCIKGAARVKFFVGGSGGDFVGAGNFAIDFSGIAGTHCNGFSVSNGGEMRVYTTCNVTTHGVGKTIGFMYASFGRQDGERGGAWLDAQPSSTTFSNNATFNDYLSCDDSLLTYFESVTFTTGSASGDKVVISMRGVIDTFGSGLSVIPGTANGSIDTGGQLL